MYIVRNDGNENLVLITLIVVDFEWKESWKWFISNMFKDVSHSNKKDEFSSSTIKISNVILNFFMSISVVYI